MIWTLALASYFAIAALLGGAGRRMGRWATVVAALPYVAHLAAIATSAADPSRAPVVGSYGWVPKLGLNLGFSLSTLSLLLSTIVAGIGLVIVAYSHRYLGAGPKLGRFLALLTLFTGGMAGIVSSDELFGLFVFWEVTTVASYLLVGFDHDRAEARAAALKALLVTGAGGLALLAGLVVLGSSAETTSITAMAVEPPQGTAITVALVLIMIGAFTKSAQTPFHFWLPGAMAAPTPASAYLHSATMVKAGIVLLALLAPAFADHPIWLPSLAAVGLTTMVVGAVAALGQRDLKLLLAYGTVSQLGFMTALIGYGLVAAAIAVLVAHAIFKAGLFLAVGAIDKTTGTRDVTQLSGLGRSSPGLAGVTLVLALSMAGAPPLLGFAAKEAAFDAMVSGSRWLGLAVAAIASVLTVVYSVRLWMGAFTTKPAIETTPLKGRYLGLIAGPGLLAALSIGHGFSPLWLGTIIADAAAQSVKLVLWPGVTTALVVSAAVLAVGFMGALTTLNRNAPAWRGPHLHRMYVGFLGGLNRIADSVTGIVQNGSLPVYLAVILSTVVTVPAVVWIVEWDGGLSLPIANGVAEVALGAVVAVTAVAAARANRRLAAVLLLGAAGYAVSGIYVTFGAPDLALTQLLVETLTVAVFALVLAKLPRRFESEPVSLSRRLRLVVAVAVGAFATLSAVVITSVAPERTVAAAYIENAVAAGGTNVVNVILTNFRALDTLGEITVLAAAALGVTALVSARRRNSDLESAETPVIQGTPT